jgi:succinoglycan biosynthesis protein ExoM
MLESMTHICVCVCTYKRPLLLARLLDEIGRQQTGGLFTHSIVVVDNDRMQSAEAVVAHFAATSAIPISYHVEPRQNIALARNKAVENAVGDYVAFIDDDEFPTPQWLATLLTACGRYGVAGVVGPVKPFFSEQPPQWLVAGRFWERPTYPTGFVIDWTKGRTNNVLLQHRLFVAGEPPFRPEFRTGEDQDFFRRMIDQGHVFMWCADAVVYEEVPPVRWSRSFLLRRAMLCGDISNINPMAGIGDIVKSLVAVAIYGVALPFASVLGQSTMMNCLIRLAHHAGRLMAAVGIHPIKEPYVTQ